jgi:hypothetical protein
LGSFVKDQLNVETSAETSAYNQGVADGMKMRAGEPKSEGMKMGGGEPKTEDEEEVKTEGDDDMSRASNDHAPPVVPGETPGVASASTDHVGPVHVNKDILNLPLPEPLYQDDVSDDANSVDANPVDAPVVEAPGEIATPGTTSATEEVGEALQLDDELPIAKPVQFKLGHGRKLFEGVLVCDHGESLEIDSGFRFHTFYKSEFIGLWRHVAPEQYMKQHANKRRSASYRA